LIAKLNVEEQDVGALYQRLAGRSMKEILFHLFEQQSFTHRDALDLDLLWAEYEFTDELIAEIFNDYCRVNPIRMTTYQEAILWHSDKDLVPSAITKPEFEMGSQMFHEKAAIFNGTVRLIGGYLNDDTPNRKGLCRWIAPNTFAMLYVVRQARGPFMGFFFPRDGGTTVSQVMH